MADERRPVDEVADAILDGTLVDWEAAEASCSAADRDLIAYLRLVARIAGVHRSDAAADLLPPSERFLSPQRLAGTSEQASHQRSTVEKPFETWGHLTVLEQIGSGAFGEVYRAWDSRLDREVALKLLAVDEPPREGSTVIEEGSLLARVRHPNIVTVYGAERISGRVGLWMEFIKGRPLEEALREQGPFSAHEAALIGLSVCRALSAVHRAGLLHRDIKAQNVTREDGGRVVLMDFGAGRLFSQCPGRTRGDLAGTPLYLAPELFAGQEAGVQSDIYSLGVLLFHLVTASFPVGGATVQDLRQAHHEGRRRFLRDERPDLLDEFVAVVEQAISPDPRSRFQSAGAMEAALARVVASRRRHTHLGIRRWLLGSFVAAALLAATVALVPRSWQDRVVHPGTGSRLPPQTPSLSADIASSVVVRKVSLPSVFMAGRPSPDGQFFAFSDENGNLAMMEVSTGRIRRLTTDASLEARVNQYAESSVISTDGKFAAYTWWALDGKYEMRVIGTDGKRPRVLVRSDAIDLPRPLEWSRDGQSILSILARRDGTRQIAFVSVEDGEVRTVRQLGRVLPRHASLSPDGAFIVYDFPQELTDSARDIFIVGADGSNDHALIQHPANDFAPVWTPDGRQVLFASDRSGTMDVWRVAVAADLPLGEPEVVHRDIGRMSLLGLTDRGSYYYQLLVGAVEVYAADLSPGGGVGKRGPLGSGYSGSNISSTWSRDGQQVAYASRQGLVGFDRSSTTLVIRVLQTGEERELIPALNSFLVRSWSPDGRQILVQGEDSRGRSGIFGIDAETGRARPLVLTDRPSNETNIGRGEWMPDGDRILYRDNAKRALMFRDLKRGTDDVALDFRAEGIDGISGGVLGPGFKMSPDGQVLAFSASIREGTASANSLRIRTADGTSHELLRVREPERLVLQDWEPHGALLFTRWRAGQAPSLWRMSTGSSTPEPLGLTMDGLRDVSAHPDGSRITFTAGSPELEVWVLENFLTELVHR